MENFLSPEKLYLRSIDNCCYELIIIGDLLDSAFVILLTLVISK